MSIIKYQNSVFISNYDKIVELILNKINFLIECAEKTHDIKLRKIISDGINRFENLLKLEGKNQMEFTKQDIKNIANFAYDQIRKISLEFKKITD